MLIQCNYQVGDFRLNGGNIYYKGVEISHTNHSSIMYAGTDEAFLLAGKYPLTCSFLVIVQSRYPVFYECSKVEIEKDKMKLYLTNNQEIVVKAHRDGATDRLLVSPVYVI